MQKQLVSNIDSYLRTDPTNRILYFCARMTPDSRHMIWDEKYLNPDEVAATIRKLQGYHADLAQIVIASGYSASTAVGVDIAPMLRKQKALRSFASKVSLWFPKQLVRGFITDILVPRPLDVWTAAHLLEEKNSFQHIYSNFKILVPRSGTHSLIFQDGEIAATDNLSFPFGGGRKLLRPEITLHMRKIRKAAFA